MEFSLNTTSDGTKPLSKVRIRLLVAVTVALFSLFATVAVLSYIFTWKEDQSIGDIPEIVSRADLNVANHAGVMGFGLGDFLVGSICGIGSFALLAALWFLTVQLFRNAHVNWARTSVVTLLGIISLSFAATFVSSVVNPSWSNVYGNGPGGCIGEYFVPLLVLYTGKWITAAIILLLAATPIYIIAEKRILSLSLQPSESQEQEKNDGVVEDEHSETGAESVDVCDPVEGVAADPAKVIAPAATDTFPAPSSSDGVLSTGGSASPVPTAADPDVKITGPIEHLTTDIEEELPQLDIRSDVDRYEFPSLEILKDYADKRFTIPKDEIDRNIEKIKMTLASFKISIRSITASVGYTVTLYRINLGEGVRVNSVKLLEDDIAIKIGIKGVRVVMLSDAVGIEVPNNRPSVVPLKAILNSDAFRCSKGELPIALGYTITTKAKVFDLSDAPHLLVAGATKQGKSVGLNAIISSLLYVKHPTELKFVFIDPKMVEFQQYSKLLNHYLALLPPLDGSDEADSAIVKDPKNAESVLRSLCVEMDDRYKLLAAAGVNKITDYNEKYRNRHLLPSEGHHFLPYLVVVVDEYADLTKATFGSDRNIARSIENSINRLAAKGRAAGLHVIIATQRPSVDVITGTIKGNFPTRLAFRTAQRQDSQTILGMAGAEKLIGKGDMLFFTGADAERVQCALVDSDEIDTLTRFIASQVGYHQKCSQPYYLPDPGSLDGSPADGSETPQVDMKNLDSMFAEAARLAVMNQSVSTSLLQRKLSLGFARAGRVMDQLEAAGIVGPGQGSRPRDVLVPDADSLNEILETYMR